MSIKKAEKLFKEMEEIRIKAVEKIGKRDEIGLKLELYLEGFFEKKKELEALGYSIKSAKQD